MSFSINQHQDGHLSITCHLCGRTSHHPQDVDHKFCGHCHRFHIAVQAQGAETMAPQELRQWVWEPFPVAFDGQGHLIDGSHRLAALELLRQEQVSPQEYCSPATVWVRGLGFQALRPRRYTDQQWAREVAVHWAADVLYLRGPTEQRLKALARWVHQKSY